MPIETDIVKSILIRDKYIEVDEHRPAVINAARNKWVIDHPVIRPAFPNAYGVESDCPICRDAGFVYPRVNGLPDYSRVIACECGEEQRKNESIRHELERAGIKETSANQYTFDNFQQVKGTELAYKAARAFTEGEAQYVILMLYGPPGNGKTHLLYAVYRDAIVRGKKARFIVWPDIISLAGQTKGNAGNFESVFQPAKDCDFLCLDEVKFTDQSGRYIPWICDKFEEIINYRFRGPLETMITTNHDIREFPKSVLSRFSDGTICKLVNNSGEDYRKMKRARR